jgi:DNA-binding XRE family transcriptional regulator
MRPIRARATSFPFLWAGVGTFLIFYQTAGRSKGQFPRTSLGAYSLHCTFPMLLHQLYTNYIIILTIELRCHILQRMEVDVQKLKRLREDQVLSQRELARMANLAYGTVWRLENGYPEARTSTIRKIAGALGVEPRELVKKEEE